VHYNFLTMSRANLYVNDFGLKTTGIMTGALFDMVLGEDVSTNSYEVSF